MFEHELSPAEMNAMCARGEHSPIQVLADPGLPRDRGYGEVLVWECAYCMAALYPVPA